MIKLTNGQRLKIKSHVDIIAMHFRQLNHIVKNATAEQSAEMDDLLSKDYPFEVSLDEISASIELWQEAIGQAYENSKDKIK